MEASYTGRVVSTDECMQCCGSVEAFRARLGELSIEIPPDLNSCAERGLLFHYRQRLDDGRRSCGLRFFRSLFKSVVCWVGSWQLMASTPPAPCVRGV